MRRTLIILSLIFQILLTSLQAQSNYPIYVSPSLMPPYSLKLSDYSAHGSQRLMFTIVVNDLDVANLPVKLRIRMETAGVTIENPVTIHTTPIFLDGGSAIILFGEDLTDYFNINNLTFKGYSKEAYRRSGMLPEGFYKFTVEVLHFHTNRVISNAGSATAWMALGKPPVLRMPLNDAQLGEYAGIPITFSWLASNVGNPAAVGSIRYKFQMWEMRAKGVSPYNVAASMPVFHEHVTGVTNYPFNPASVMMEEGMSYAWRVTAYDQSGLVPFTQNGHSEVRTFTYKSRCEGVTDIETSVTGQKGSFIWLPEQNHTSYNVEVRNDTLDWFSASETFDSKVEFYGLEHGQTYEMRVQAVCNGDPGSTSDFSHWQQLNIPQARATDQSEECPDCGCDDDIPRVELTNFELRHDLMPGDILSNKTGTTRFIVKSAEPQGNGIYRGIFLFWAEIWGLKIPCEYRDLQVNTDNVIVNMDYKSIYDPTFMFDVDEMTDGVDGLLDNVAVLTSDGNITDTIRVRADFDNIIVEDGQLVAITIDQTGTANETPLDIREEEAQNKLITNSNGDELVVTSKGEVMGVKEYQETSGGNKRLMDNYNKEKESNHLTESTMVSFRGHPKQKYGFDTYTEQKSVIQHHYPALRNDYRPAFKSIESFSYDKVGVNTVEGIKFRDEMGIPSAAIDGGISLNGAHNGSIKALYAYREKEDSTEEVVGKLNVLSFDNQPRRVHIIPVNKANIPQASELQSTLNKIYSQAVTTWTVISENSVLLHFPGGKMTHEGSGGLSTYNADQKAIARAYETSGRQFERGDMYLFFVEGATFKDRSLAGFMPLQRQIGFIYDNPSLEIVAHELTHGAFNLRHTFSPEAFIINEGKTQNLMDYAGGSELWKHQWDAIHEPERVLFAWGQVEEEGAYTWTPVDKQHALLFNHIYDNNHIGSMNYLKAIEDAIAKGNDDALDSAYTEDEAEKWTKEQKQWIDGWKIRAMNSDDVFNDIIKSIKETEKGEKIEKIVLRPKHIYIGKYEYEGVKYPVAIYGSGEQTVMTKTFTKIQVADTKELEDKEKKEHIYCDETYTKYLIIAFYEDGKDNPSMIMQVEKFDFSQNQSTVDMWLKYLGILRESIDGKSIEEIFEDYDILTPAEISRVREQIEQLEDGEKKEEHYLTLQEKVPYHNQRNNDQTQYVSDRMCNLTSEAACFEYLGISCPDDDLQFEDYLEQLREDNEYGVRTSVGARDSLAKHLGAAYTKIDYYAKVSAKKEDIKSDLLPKLKEGCAVMISVWPGCKGHLVRLQSITVDGLIVDDPYGKVTDFDTREACNSGGYDANSKTEENSKGNDNLWKWDDIKNITIKYAEIYSK